MDTSTNKIRNVKATDPFDRLIHEKGLRIKNIIIDKELNLIVLILNNAKVIESKISNFPRLKEVDQKALDNWRLISNGVGISWESLDEDLSLKGFIKSSALNNALLTLENSTGN